MPDPREVTTHVLEQCAALGFAAAGVCPVEASRFAGALQQWLSDGAHGSMGYMAELSAQRLDPASILPGASWIIMVADLYTPRERSVDEPPPAGHGRIARYARGRNYHEVVKRRLHALSDHLRDRHPGSQFRSFTDTAPVMEREHAARSGLGWLAKNTMLIHPRLGSYFVIGGVITTLELEIPAGQRESADHCGTCTRCIDACPTGAITPYRVDGSRCISYLTIERREPVPPEFFGSIGTWLYGCDVCQEVCPHNSPRALESLPLGPEVAPPARRPGGWGVPAAAAARAEPAAVRNPEYTPRLASLHVQDVLDWGEAERREAFTTSALKRASLEMMKRNALIVAGNIIRDDPDRPEARALESRVRRAAEDPTEPELVRRTAREVLRALGR